MPKKKEEKELTKKEKKATNNAKAMNALFCALREEFEKVASYKSAYEIWDNMGFQPKFGIRY
jgi:hypothetical protein